MTERFEDRVAAFGAVRHGVSVQFEGHAAEYTVRRDDPNLGRIVGVLAAAWAARRDVTVTASGSVIVDTEE